MFNARYWSASSSIRRMTTAPGGNQILIKETTMKILPQILIALCVLLFVGGVNAKGKSGGPHYGGGKHTSSHGGSYPGGKGRSHKDGSYKNNKTNDQYGKHK